MGIVERYILRGGFVAFAASLTVLTAIVWVSQALREVDLMTGKGQTILVFLSVTALTIPSLISVIAPIALFAAILYTLNKLNGDSELVVMTAAGMPPTQVARPFFVLAMVVAIMVGVMSTWAMPASYREIRDVLSKVRADFLTYLVREGQFVTLDQGFVFHYRERGAGGALLGIFIQDRRDPEKISTYISEAGITINSGDNNFLVLEKGFVHRQARSERSSAMVQFESYALDLAQFAGGAEAGALRPRERPTLDLLTLTQANADTFARQYFGRFRAELHDRLSAPLYVLAFAMIGFAALGQARTTRQGRGAAILVAICIVLALRVAGFAVSNLSARSAGAVVFVYALPLVGIAGSLFYAFGRTPGWARRLFTRPPAAGAQPA
ncbi:MAG: LPS export ABC transporter permease LptF [Beijerinckiaceae bacterium]|nr:LPS export ABC transporter permease LptF [Beijerinckiaceae bacterium]